MDTTTASDWEQRSTGAAFGTALGVGSLAGAISGVLVCWIALLASSVVQAAGVSGMGTQAASSTADAWIAVISGLYALLVGFVFGLLVALPAAAVVIGLARTGVPMAGVVTTGGVLGAGAWAALIAVITQGDGNHTVLIGGLALGLIPGVAAALTTRVAVYRRVSTGRSAAVVVDEAEPTSVTQAVHR